MTLTPTDDLDPPGPAPLVEVVLPPDLNVDQDQEWCEVLVDGRGQRIRFHDYHLIYTVPGLYEQLFSDTLRCTSPQVIRDLLAGVLTDQAMPARDLRVLDVGAGNGMAGEQLRALGAATVHGVDIIVEAAAAARRDRPHVYDDYLVADLTDLTPDQHGVLRAADLNTMITVAALGFGDIPPAAFGTAFNLITTPGLVAFTIKDDFVSTADRTGFHLLIERMFGHDVIAPLAQQRYRHRLSARGEPLHYVAFVTRKLRDIPAAWIT